MLCRVQTVQMHDQRVMRGPSFGREDGGDRFGVPRIACQPVDGFGGHGDKPPCTQKLCSARYVARA